jgi:hypothetical protein
MRRVLRTEKARETPLQRLVVDGETRADDTDVGFDDAPDCGGDGAAYFVSVIHFSMG